MKITIPQKILKEGLRIVERISQKSLSLPVLGNVLVRASENFLNLKTTDLEVGINWWGLAKVEEEGETTVPVRTLSSLVSFLPSEPVVLSSKNNILDVECKKQKSRIKGQSPEDFPIIPEVKEGMTFFIDAQVFSQSLLKVLDIATPSLARPGISGIFFAFGKDLLKVVATDSFRLGEKTIFLKDFSKEDSFILPQKAARELINIFAEKEENVKITFSPNQILFEVLMRETQHARVRFTSKLIEAEFPDYEEIIPKGFKTQIVLEKEAFLNQIKTASLFSGKINEVRLKVEAKFAEIMSQNPELGEYVSQIPAEMKGEKVETSFNYRFLSDGVSKIDTPKIIFELNGTSGPGILKPFEDETYLYIVMPIKPT